MKTKLAEYLMLHGILKNADAEKMAEEIVDMLINNLIERNHELEQKELLRSASRPAEAEAMRNVLEESKRLKAQLDAAEKACAAVRQYSHKVSAIGYKEGVVGSHVLMLLEEHGNGWHSPEEWDAAERAITEMRQRIANCHDRLLRGDSDMELLKLLEGNWGPPSGVGITEDKT